MPCSFARASLQVELQHRTNLGIAFLHALLSLATGVLGLVVLFGQIDTISGWDFPSTLALLAGSSLLFRLGLRRHSSASR